MSNSSCRCGYCLVGVASEVRKTSKDPKIATEVQKDSKDLDGGAENTKDRNRGAGKIRQIAPVSERSMIDIHVY